MRQRTPAPARLIASVAVVLVLAACSGDDETVETSTTTAAPVTSLATTSAPQVTQAPVVETSTTSTTAVRVGEVDFPDYRIVSRTQGDAGDTVVVLIDPSSDEALTDIDLQNVLADVVEMFPPVFEAHVVDSVEAADIVLGEELDDDQKSVLDQHYLVRLEEGFRVVFTGPFSDAGTLILGS